jgi:molecular chaperone GrpE (heat shock protein)
MTTDPRFNPPGPYGPGAGTGGPAPDPAAEPSNGTAAPAEQQVDQPVVDGELVPDAESHDVDVDALQAKAAKADEYLGLAQRTQADFENFRKRAAREAALATQR